MQDRYKSTYSYIWINNESRRDAVLITAAASASLACMVILLVVAVVRNGSLPWYCGTIGYISFFVSVISLYGAIRLRAFTQSFGKLVSASLYLSIISLAAHVFVVLLGWMSVIV
ncbi:MAG: hypothetical protein K5637_05355 [Lachnospiraceae bacterium]|nr:hypothetical protein [Lachnospiraceae bacterium]